VAAKEQVSAARAARPIPDHLHVENGKIARVDFLGAEVTART
jgi:hypothetical protein